ncbi:MULTISPECIES: KaiC domain-containing protein [Thermodesulfobacterium]|uniref:Circadian clock protein KaiC n=2 Tax=Thermodesulfobacterium commune TaxID=1741 RepID=A0A075WR87_9BACT|nr:circadian clock protein KaiC [Thermodesulfobacterium commune DSM 2178]HAA83876.1 KaiC domain-containing protein [Thermodesulfobacterium commune]HBT03764.1 KaiC domain-containing protein [Thermodesulfobacterium commune]HCE80171.1 KaiC domain-containing protein [Thermodesulfobacterium commune]HCP10575.1 KaiC domain-containing protein [Thermodesulfobacterium commune]
MQEKKENVYGIGEPDLKSIYKGGEALKKAPKLYGVSTGIEGLDPLFYVVVSENGRLVKKQLGGIPAYSVFNITGVSDTGKSLMVEQFAIKQASKGERVAFITVETPANFLAASLELRANAMGFNFKDFEDNLIIIDAASSTKLRESLPDLLATLAYVIQHYKANFTIIDSVTGLFETKEMLARNIVRRLYNFMKKWYQTALFVSQKRSGHEELTAEAAGGYAVGHIVDGTMVLAKELIDSSFKAKMYKKEIGEIVRLFRIDGCRMCGHDTKTRFLEITETGLVVIKEPISQK